MAVKWIQKAIKNKGTLRKQLKIKKGETIPVSKLEKEAKKSGVVGRRARLALILRTLRKKHHKKRRKVYGKK